MNMKENMTLTLGLAEVNLILGALGEQPYVKVADVIKTIQSQGASQLRANEPEEGFDPFGEVTTEEKTEAHED